MPPTLVVIFLVSDLLIVGGVVTFFVTGASHLTALIPAVAGGIFQAAVLGAFLAPPLRQSLMSVLAVLAILGLAVAISRPMMKLFTGASLEWNAALISQLMMAIGCAVIFCAALVFLLDRSRG